MSKYIDAEKLIAEIERLYKAHSGKYGCDEVGLNLEYLEDFIASLQQEQPQLPGIEDPGVPGKDFIPVEWVDACEMYGKWKIVRQEQPEVDLGKEITEHAENMPHGEFTHESECDEHEEWAKREFRHFYELGLKARKEG